MLTFPLKKVFTIANFGSVILVTVTVTRKMLTMILSVVYYGHSLNPKQWLGVVFVFGGIGYEAWMKQRSEMGTRKKKEEAMKSGAGGGCDLPGQQEAVAPGAVEGKKEL